MSKAVFEPSILSRPVYGVLEPRTGKSHLMIADAEGVEAILDMAGAAPPDLFANAHIIYIPKRTGTLFVEKLQALSPAQLYVGPSYEAAVPRLRRVLSSAHMGLQVYLAGTEGLIGQAMREATEAGIPHPAIQTEHRGSTARRVQSPRMSRTIRSSAAIAGCTSSCATTIPAASLHSRACVLMPKIQAMFQKRWSGSNERSSEDSGHRGRGNAGQRTRHPFPLRASRR